MSKLKDLKIKAETLNASKLSKIFAGAELHQCDATAGGTDLGGPSHGNPNGICVCACSCQAPE